MTPRGQISLTYQPGTGYVQSMTAPGNETLTFTYNQSLQTGTTFSGTINGSITRTYDNDFRMTSQSINGGNTITYQYDNDGLLTQAGDLTIARDPQNGLISGTTLGNVTDTISYTDLIDGNNYGYVAHYHAQYNTDPLFDVTYERNSLGRITKKTEIIDGESHLFEYSYYPTGWLHQVKKDGEYISTYTYDSNGNRLTHATPGGTVTATYDNQDRLIQYGDTTYTYTTNGELLTKTENDQTTTYTYDVLGNLTRVDLPDGTIIEYLIDAANRRIGKKVNGVLTQGFLYDSQLHPIAELDGSGQIVSIFGPGYMIKNSTTYRLITDHLGSIRLVVSKETGEILQQLDFDEFGNVITDTNPSFQPFGFAGGLYDQKTGLIRFGARDYYAIIGRWTMKDPIMFGGGDTTFYGYCINNPVDYVDPGGLDYLSFNGNELIWVFEKVISVPDSNSNGPMSITIETGRKSWPANSGNKKHRKLPNGIYSTSPNDKELHCGHERSWGPLSYRLHESLFTGFWNRVRSRSGGFHIHGGYEEGTAGCIEFRDYSDSQTMLREFDKMMQQYGQEIVLNVNY